MEQASQSVNMICQAVICEKCGDSGTVLKTDEEGRLFLLPCDCDAMKRARYRKMLKESGLERVVEVMTFDTWQAEEPWQNKARQTAQQWTAEIVAGKRPWLFFGGAVGSGKTHLCTAACGKLMEAGFAVHYMLWPEISRQLKACVNDAEEFQLLVSPLKRTPVLYIDDLFKTKRSDTNAVRDVVTPADVRVAFEIIDARVRMNRPTIISTEWMLDELVEADEGTFSRVNCMSEGYQVQIGRDKGRNWRMKGATR